MDNTENNDEVELKSIPLSPNKTQENSNITQDNSEKHESIGIEINYDLASHIKENLPPEKTGLYVQAHNLNYYVPKPIKKGEPEENKKLYLLKNLTFTMEPGRMVLLMGIPGSGKSVLLKTLGNRLGKGSIEGELLFNRHPCAPSTHQRDTIYVSQDDRHIALLTVKETLEFSANCNMGEMVDEESKKERVRLILEQLGLSHTSNTIIGNQFFRGISGGQKRRVTIANEFTKCPNMILMDEPTTGLDSATSYNVLNKVKSIANEARASVMVSLLQPSPELTNLFDDVLILGEGGTLVYFGPLDSLLGYFESVGLAPLPEQPLAEFIQEITIDPSKYAIGADRIQSLSKSQASHTDDGEYDLVKFYLESQIHQNVVQSIPTLIPQDIKPFDFSIQAVEKGKVEKSSLAYEMKQLLGRHLKVMKIMRMQYATRFFQAVFMGCVVGSLFVDMSLSHADARNRLGLIYFSMVLHIWTTIGSVEEFYTLRGIFDDQKDGKYYRNFPYFITLVITKIPISLIESLLFSICCYWIAGFRARADSFFIFVLGLALTNVIAQGIFQVTSVFASTQLLASLICPAIVVLFMIMCGYMKPIPEIGGWWIWLNALSPLRYVIDMLASNELHGLVFSCAPNELVPPLDIAIAEYNGQQTCQPLDGDAILHQFGFSENYYMRFVDIVIILGFACTFFFIFFLGIKYVRFENKAPPKVINLKKKKEGKEKKAKEVKHKWNGCYMTFQDLNYTVDAKKINPTTNKKENVTLELLKDVNGYVVPGMCALMGPSGAGKSTLMDVLAKRKNVGIVTGDIRINGTDVNDINITRFTGYVEQQDILSGNLTIREAIEFSANCRLPPSYAEKDRVKLIDEILQVLSLTKLQNTTIGPNPTLGISLANRKKVSIGIELASDPHLLFLDEPTSGLDSAAALKVMNCVKKIADSGRTVICTIHQPSQEIFEKFDQLLLLDKGKVIYFGPTGENSTSVINHFSNAGYQYQEGRNPADYILEIAEHPPSNGQSASEYFKSSNFYSDSVKRLSDKDIVPEGVEVPKYKGKYSAPIGAQLKSLIKRAWLNHVRRPQTILLRFLRSFVPAIVVGTLFVRLGYSQNDARNKIAMIFLGFLFGGMASIGKVPTVIEDRSVYYRESSAGTYPAHLYLLSVVITDLPMMMLTAFSYWIPTFFLTGLDEGHDGWKFFYSLLVYLLVIMCYDSLAMVFALTLPTIPIATLVCGVGLNFLGLFGGFFIPKTSIKRGWIWMHYLVFSKYGLESLAVTELNGQDFVCKEGEYALINIDPTGNNTMKPFCPIPNGETILNQYGFSFDRQFYNCIILFGYFIGYTFIGYLALRYINHMKR
ncbi:hypothetical protein DICPUDRAFT_55375 [Dictyostelium purpureum]|uniref:ABC transporter domain-containing protein n=1 Tax=Dictyostelium purpureum TaxID=5786 RepID=F0ZLT1_DICPU|nr:uncharacterized protein DICPUDRAFT_55375 [Dictyostelium purpureum]EGC35111.1 hypothetical protein DICPUDRAFT_55375 [Dictyostelium purpureum]|eukprot:XP_003288363.1 hypothetical protein DICPUDRAFT_55375 [Dictyostelium purpureum]